MVMSIPAMARPADVAESMIKARFWIVIVVSEELRKKTRILSKNIPHIMPAESDKKRFETAQIGSKHCFGAVYEVRSCR